MALVEQLGDGRCRLQLAALLMALVLYRESVRWFSFSWYQCCGWNC